MIKAGYTWNAIFTGRKRKEENEEKNGRMIGIKIDSARINLKKRREKKKEKQ